MKWIFNILGILIYFMLRYVNRADKKTKFSGLFWLNDNWSETVTILLFNAVLMLLMIFGGLTIDLNKFIPSLPDGVAFAGDLAAYFLIGAVISHGTYELFKTKVKK